MFELRPYQLEDVERALPHSTFGIFNEQRTGKTPTAISIMRMKKMRKVVIVCTKSTVPQWCAEWENWYPGSPAIAVLGTPKRRKEAVENWTNGALVISYDNLKTTSVATGLVDSILKKRPDAVIADEAHRFKTVTSCVFKAMRQLMKIPNRLALSGTPAHGKPEEIYALIHWLRPDLFPSQWKFTEQYFRKALRRLPGGRTYTEIIGWQPGKQEELQTILSRISIQRKRIDVMPWLPDKEYIQIRLEPSAAQRKYLDELEAFYETEHVITQGTLDRLIRYRQICNAPALLDLKGASPKYDWLLDYAKDNPDVPTIIFSKFTSFLNMLDMDLETPHRMIIGDTSTKQRSKNVLDFQNGIYNLLLINIDAGKEGLTLDKAECIIFVDTYPPAADIQQAEDRFIATSEEKANKNHTIMQLMLAGTYDEQLYKLVEQRASSIDVLNDYTKYLQRK